MFHIKNGFSNTLEPVVMLRKLYWRERTLTNAIESLRCKMIEVAVEKGSLMDPTVLAISRQLDMLIVQEQRRRIVRETNAKRKIYSFWRSPISCLKNIISI